MKVEDVMTSDVVTVRPTTSLKEVAGILIERRISGVPVVDEQGKVVGVVSEGDILFKERGRTERRGILTLFTDATYGTGGQLKLEARTAEEAMTAPAQTIPPWRSVSAAAEQMLDAEVKRLPVVDDAGRLLGIVTRTDLVRAFVRSDAEIEREIREEVLARSLLLDPASITVAVAGGEVLLGGTVLRRTDADLVPALVAKVPGVVGVDSSLGWKEDDRKQRSAPLVLGTRHGT